MGLTVSLLFAVVWVVAVFLLGGWIVVQALDDHDDVWRSGG